MGGRDGSDMRQGGTAGQNMAESRRRDHQTERQQSLRHPASP